jgi:hypothetical protein
MPFDMRDAPPRLAPHRDPEPLPEEWSDLWGLEETGVPAVAVLAATAAAVAAIVVLYLVGA